MVYKLFQKSFRGHQWVPRKLYSSNNVRPIRMAFNSFEGPQTDKKAIPLIIMHGLFGSKQNWRGISRALESKLKRKIYTVDARNHGNSPHTSEFSSEYMAADVIEFMKNENIEKANILGHSMGGRTMMYLAMKYPEQVEGAIIVDVSPISIPRDFSGMRNLMNAMLSINVPSDVPMAEGRKLIENQIKSVVDQKETVDFIMLNLRKRESGEFYWTANVKAILENFSTFADFDELIANLQPYKGPTSFICGNRSNFVDPNDWPKIQAIFPNSEIHWLDAGHLVHFEAPAKFLDLVTQFVNK